MSLSDLTQKKPLSILSATAFEGKRSNEASEMPRAIVASSAFTVAAWHAPRPDCWL